MGSPRRQAAQHHHELDPKLIDLSVAQTFAGARRASSPIGTDAYMAPEQCDPALFATIEERTDVWGLGLTLYEALAGRRPFPPGDESSEELVVRFPQVAHSPDPLPDAVLPPLDAVVLACLEKDPALRPTAAEIAEALEPLAALLPLPRLGRFRPGSAPSRPPALAR
jgi:eukaryotic-like serine/threonine-protein kinase